MVKWNLYTRNVRVYYWNNASFDTPYNRGKCGFKLVQYLNLNKPVIASDVGVNCSIVGHCGLIVDTQTSWGEALENLLFNEHFYNECLKNISNEFQKNIHMK